MAKAIMIQGTMSNAGKSLVAAGLCRIFKQDGYKVAPFKAQNMALNSYITREGLEMGRAQVTQAEAAGIEPSVLMNPILLKPTNDTSSQVIVGGEVMENMSAKEYYKHKKELVFKVKEAYDKLAAQYDIIVLEGAGSPAEINLKENDIVNMFMAKMAKAPVLLVGDIDRGGVFASLVGTMALFEPEERELVKGIIINKFRGDLSILEPGLCQLTDMIHKPVTGVIPYMNLDIDDEDSLSERFSKKNTAGLVDLAVIRLPRISNFTDFNPLESMASVTVRYVDHAADLGDPDMILLPGTKNTMEDLLWMRQNGLEASVLKHAAKGKPVFGICGGYQMLGRTLKDPHGTEHGGQMAGMGLLPGETIFEKEKTRTRVTGTFDKVEGVFSGLSGIKFEGYEIHMGTTTLEGGNILSHIAEEGMDAKADGLSCGNIYGSYVHGIFDCGDVAGTIVSSLLRAKGISGEQVAGVDMAAYKERQYDLLAEGIRKNMDMDMIYRIIEEGVDYGK
ncbi:cobyric acid synthase [Anaerovorax odorimutans]|uniref:Cobyric acid synthase n=1 Tax=Anaerovorax odorimutans TaxID=109327 RepID=A0ABT1RMF2_9FIRM|nr:cobyric acid synthase [Anaerovorax odorimutans]MCQ4636370.1 cobyric acid synthase [Anaerovorax odorimutans]